MSAPARQARQAPYDILTARDALVEAATLNLQAFVIAKMEVEDSAEHRRLVGHAANLAAVAQALATYALALDRWQGTR